MKDEKKKNDVKEQNIEFEEMESAEEFGRAQDYLTGVGIGVGIVAGVVTIVT